MRKNKRGTNLVTDTALTVLGDLKKSYKDLMEVNNRSFVPLSELKIAMAIYLNGFKKSKKDKLSEKEEEVFTHVYEQIKRTLGALYTAYKDYSIKYRAKNIPDSYIFAALEAIVKSVKKQKK